MIYGSRLAEPLSDNREEPGSILAIRASTPNGFSHFLPIQTPYLELWELSGLTLGWKKSPMLRIYLISRSTFYETPHVVYSYF